MELASLEEAACLVAQADIKDRCHPSRLCGCGCALVLLKSVASVASVASSCITGMYRVMADAIKGDVRKIIEQN
jgi:hypothetical protein